MLYPSVFCVYHVEAAQQELVVHDDAGAQARGDDGLGPFPGGDDGFYLAKLRLEARDEPVHHRGRSDDKAALEAEIGKFKEVNDSVSISSITEADVEKLKTAGDELMKFLNDISMKMYQQAGGQQGGFDPSQAGGFDPNQAGGSDDIIDGESKEL